MTKHSQKNFRQAADTEQKRRIIQAQSPLQTRPAHHRRPIIAASRARGSLIDRPRSIDRFGYTTSSQISRPYLDTRYRTEINRQHLPSSTKHVATCPVHLPRAEIQCLLSILPALLFMLSILLQDDATLCILQALTSVATSTSPIFPVLHHIYFQAELEISPSRAQ